MPAKATAAPAAPSGFVRNHLWPILGGLVGAVLTALAAGVPGALADGFQAEDWGRIGAAASGAAFGYVATIWDRYGGKDRPYTQPAK